MGACGVSFRYRNWWLFSGFCSTKIRGFKMAAGARKMNDVAMWRAVESTLGCANMGVVPSEGMINMAINFVQTRLGQRDAASNPVLRALKWVRDEGAARFNDGVGGGILQRGMRSARRNIMALREHERANEMHQQQAQFRDNLEGLLDSMSEAAEADAPRPRLGGGRG